MCSTCSWKLRTNTPSNLALSTHSIQDKVKIEISCFGLGLLKIYSLQWVGVSGGGGKWSNGEALGSTSAKTLAVTSEGARRATAADTGRTSSDGSDNDWCLVEERIVKNVDWEDWTGGWKIGCVCSWNSYQVLHGGALCMSALLIWCTKVELTMAWHLVQPLVPTFYVVVGSNRRLKAHHELGDHNQVSLT